MGGDGRGAGGCCPVFAARLAQCAAALARMWTGIWGRCWPGRRGRRAWMSSGAAGVVGGDGVAGGGVAGGRGGPGRGGRAIRRGRSRRRCVAGILSLEDGARVVALRSRAWLALAGRGGMVSVAEPAAAVRARLARWGGRLSVAVVNGPSATVVAGEPEALAELAAAWRPAGVRARAVEMDYAAHCAQVETIRGEILAARPGSRLARLRCRWFRRCRGSGWTGRRRRRSTGMRACGRRWSSTGRYGY